MTLNIENLSKSYNVNGRQLDVLRGVSLTAAPKGITVIVGRSGCGKTTLLRVLAGLESLGGGIISEDMKRPKGMVFQEARLMPWLTTWDNITFGLKKGSYTGEYIQSLVDLVGLTGFERAYPSQLSGGMQQRAALARVLAFDPGVILMDEPFAALDYFTRSAMQKELIRICRQSGKAIVFVTHSLEEALMIGEKIIVLDEGVVKEEYDLSDISYPREPDDHKLLQIKKHLLQTLNYSQSEERRIVS